MSHNLYTINNEGADVVSYHGANKGVLYFGFGTADNYPASLTNGSVFEWYAPASERINTIGATFGTGSATGWINSITIPAGTYLFNHYCLTPTLKTTTGYAVSVILFKENGTDFFQGHIYNGSTSDVNGAENKYTRRSFVQTYTSSVTITFELIVTSVASVSDIGQRISTSQFFFLRKLL